RFTGAVGIRRPKSSKPRNALRACPSEPVSRAGKVPGPRNQTQCSVKERKKIIMVKLPFRVRKALRLHQGASALTIFKSLEPFGFTKEALEEGRKNSVL